MIIPREYQMEAVNSIDSYFIGGRGSNPLIIAPTACHAKNQKILMFDGSFKAVQDILVGDRLMGVDSSARLVLQLHSGIDDMYKITPKTKNYVKQDFTVNSGHILSLQATNTSDGFFVPKNGIEKGAHYYGGEIVNIRVSDYLQSNKTAKHLLKLRRSNGIEFPQTDKKPIEPYFLGVLIGDGCSRNCTLSVCTPDIEIKKEIYRQAEIFNCSVRESAKVNNLSTDYFFSKLSKGVEKTAIKAAFIKTGLNNLLSGDKYIPYEYKYTSMNERLDILAGLIDTDGSLANGLGFEYSSKSKKLADDVAYISRTLGFHCSISEKIVNDVVYYRLYIGGDISRIPVRVAHKKPILVGKKNVLRTGFYIKHIGRGEYFGFTLDGDHLYHDDNLFIHHNSGKSIILAVYIEKQLKAWPNCRFMMVTHQKELIEQNYEKLINLWPEVDAGIYSASVGRKEANNSVLFAGIQSVYNKSSQIGKIDVLLVDEAHMIPKKGNGMYQKFIADMLILNPLLKVVGLTATPYRLDGGLLYKGKDRLFDGICYDISVKFMLENGYITPLTTPKHGVKTKLDVSGVPVVNGDYVQYKLTEQIESQDIIPAAVNEMILHGALRNSWLVFAHSINHAHEIQEELNRQGIFNCEVVTGMTKKHVRKDMLEQFKAGRIKCLINVNVLTTGFDAPNIDMIVMLRPTKSTSLYIQMLGRGVRLFDDKIDCMVLDFAGNIAEHGAFDDPEVTDPKSKGNGDGEAPTKNCPECENRVHAGKRICPFCLYLFPIQEEPKHREFASTLAIISGDNEGEKSYDITYLTFNLHRKSGMPDSCRVDFVRENGKAIVSEYLCFEHQGFAKNRACVWWSQVMPDHALPLTSMNAVVTLHQHATKRITRITTTKPTTTNGHKSIVKRYLNLQDLT